jgi:hypothetical protein
VSKESDELRQRRHHLKFIMMIDVLSALLTCPLMALMIRFMRLLQINAFSPSGVYLVYAFALFGLTIMVLFALYFTGHALSRLRLLRRLNLPRAS